MNANFLLLHFCTSAQAATELLDAERATLFIVDEEAKELWSRVAGGTSQEIRLPMTQGLAGEAAVKRRTCTQYEEGRVYMFNRLCIGVHGLCMGKRRTRREESISFTTCSVNATHM